MAAVSIAIAGVCVVVFLLAAFVRNSAAMPRLAGVAILAVGVVILVVRGLFDGTSPAGVANSISLCSLIVLLATRGDPTLLFDPDDWGADEETLSQEENARITQIAISQITFLGLVIGAVTTYVAFDWTFLD